VGGGGGGGGGGGCVVGAVVAAGAFDVVARGTGRVLAEVGRGGAVVVAFGVTRVGGFVVGGSFGAGSREARSACVGTLRGGADGAAWPLAPACCARARVVAMVAVAATAPTDSAAVVALIATVARRRRATDGLPRGAGGRAAAGGTPRR
jgi:hypothetical protein